MILCAQITLQNIILKKSIRLHHFTLWTCKKDLQDWGYMLHYSKSSFPYACNLLDIKTVRQGHSIKCRPVFLIIVTCLSVRNLISYEYQYFKLEGRDQFNFSFQISQTLICLKMCLWPRTSSSPDHWCSVWITY